MARYNHTPPPPYCVASQRPYIGPTKPGNPGATHAPYVGASPGPYGMAPPGPYGIGSPATLRRNSRSYRQYSNTSLAQELIATLRRDDETKRFELRTIYIEVMNLLNDLDDKVKRHLIAEGTIKEDLQSDLQRHLDHLNTNDCPILVAGETSSGKSSLLNLLLGREILPNRLLSCTSVICQLRYGPTLSAKVTDQHGVVKEIDLDPDTDPVEQLSKYIYKEEEREGGQSQYKSVEIFLPLELLKTGVYIVDSPGVGENPEMDSLLLDYVTNNEIFAFIYVIKSDNAGGVQEDRLQKILEYIVSRQRSNVYGSFDPHAAMFVCNRWDLVPTDERETVLEDTLKKLARSWPDIDSSQVFCLSSTKAWQTRLAGYVSHDFSSLLDGLQRLIPIGLQRKIQLSYKWLEHLLSRVHHHVNGYLSKTKLSATELQLRHKATELRLHKVEKESDVIMKRLDKQLDKNIRTISAKLSLYLNCTDAIRKITQWTTSDLPFVHEDDIWSDVEAILDSLIEKKLANLLKDWDDSTKLFHGVQLDLLVTFKEEFLLLDHQLSAVENYIQSDEISLTERGDLDAFQYLGITDNIESVVPNGGGYWDDVNVNTFEKIAVGAAPVLVPTAVSMILGAPVLLMWDFKKWRRRSVAQKNLVKYLENPIGFTRERARQTLDKVSDIEVVSEYVYNQLEPARVYLESMKASIPKLIKSTRQLIEDISQDKRTSQQLQQMYARLEGCIPEEQEKLAEFGNIFIRKYDFKFEQIEIVPASSILKNPGSGTRLTPIWAELRPARFTHQGKMMMVTVKTYLRKVRAMQLLMEETHLRRVKHPNIVRYHGSFECQRGIPGFILEPGLVRARQELFGFRSLPRRSKGKNVLMERCRRILEQVGMGLEYLHGKGLVHMELSLDTVMLLTNQDEVKLTNICEPQTSPLPSDLSIQASQFIYLPPEVLRGSMYRWRGDMYSLGLIAWELWNQEMAFKRQRDARLDHFIQTIRPSLLKGDEDNPLNELIKKCVFASPDSRINSTYWVNEIKKIDLTAEEDEDKKQTIVRDSEKIKLQEEENKKFEKSEKKNGTSFFATLSRKDKKSDKKAEEHVIKK